jgi:hypothetical protein
MISRTLTVQPILCNVILRNKFHIKKQLVKIMETDNENMVKSVVLVPRTDDRSSPAVRSIWSVGLSSVCVTLKTYEY